VSASLSESSGSVAVNRSIGLTRSRVPDMTKAAAMIRRNSSASHSRRSLIVAAIIQAYVLKNINTASITRGSALTAMVPIAVRCDSVMRTAHPSTAPTPQAVRINTRATKTAIPSR
jgi:hypothetical protein